MEGDATITLDEWSEFLKLQQPVEAVHNPFIQLHNPDAVDYDKRNSSAFRNRSGSNNRQSSRNRGGDEVAPQPMYQQEQEPIHF